MNPFSKFAQAAKAKPLDQPLRDGRWLQAGVDYAAVIEDLDAERAEETGRVGITLRAKEGIHKDTIFVMNKEGTGFGWQMRMLVGALLPDAEAQRVFKELLSMSATCRRVLESFRGMQVAVRLQQTDGFRIVADGESGRYRALGTGGAVLAEADTLIEAERRAKSLGHRKSYRNIKYFGVLDEDTKKLNLQAFDNAVASIKKSAQASGDPTAPDAGGYSVPDAKW